MIGDSEEDRKRRRATAGPSTERDKIRRALTPVVRPARDTDSLENRVKKLEADNENMKAALTELGFDFADYGADGPAPSLSVVTP